MAEEIHDTLTRLGRVGEETTDAKTKEQLLALVKKLRRALQNLATERNNLLASMNEQTTTIAELRAAATAQQQVHTEQARLAGASTSSPTAGTSTTPLELATSFKNVIDVIQAEARQSSGVATTIKSMDIEVKGLVQVEGDKSTVFVLPSTSSPIDSNSLSTLRVSFGAIPVAAPATPAPATVTVPDVRNKGLNDAISDLQKAGLGIGTITQQTTMGISGGTVVSQQPGAGSVVGQGTQISLVVASTAGTVTVPNVVGLTLAKATDSIASFGLRVGPVEILPLASPPSDTVIRQSPSAGQQVPPGTSVALVAGGRPSIARL